MHFSATILDLTAILALTAATPVYTDRDSTATILHDKRNSYGLGVNIFSQNGCVDMVADRNHDVNSCQAASINNSPNQWLSMIVKNDGADDGTGCMTTFSDQGCTMDSKVFTLSESGGCVTPGYDALCVVVAERGSDGTCGTNTPTCGSSSNTIYN